MPIPVYVTSEFYFRNWNTNREFWIILQPHVKVSDFDDWLNSLQLTPTPSKVGAPPSVPHEYHVLTPTDVPLGDNILNTFVPVMFHPAADIGLNLMSGQQIKKSIITQLSRSSALHIADEQAAQAFAALNSTAIQIKDQPGPPNTIASDVPYVAAFANALIKMRDQKRNGDLSRFLAMAFYCGSHRRFYEATTTVHGTFVLDSEKLVDLLMLDAVNGMSVTNYHSLLGHAIRIDRSNDFSLATLASLAIDDIELVITDSTSTQTVDLSPLSEGSADVKELFEHLLDPLPADLYDVSMTANPDLASWADVQDTPIVLLPQSITLRDADKPLNLYRRRKELGTKRDLASADPPEGPTPLNFADVRQLSIYERSVFPTPSVFTEADRALSVVCRFWQIFEVSLRAYRSFPKNTAPAVMRIVPAATDDDRFRAFLEFVANLESSSVQIRFVDAKGAELSVDWIGAYHLPWDSSQTAGGYVGLALSNDPTIDRATLLVRNERTCSATPVLIDKVATMPRWEVLEVDDSKPFGPGHPHPPDLPFDAIDIDLSNFSDKVNASSFVPVVLVRGQAQFLPAQGVQSAVAVLDATYPHRTVGDNALVADVRMDLINFNALRVATDNLLTPDSADDLKNLMPFFSPGDPEQAPSILFRYRYHARDKNLPVDWKSIDALHLRAGQPRKLLVGLEHKNGDILLPKVVGEGAPGNLTLRQPYDFSIEHAALTRSPGNAALPLISAAVVGSPASAIQLTIDMNQLQGDPPKMPAAARAIAELAHADSLTLVFDIYRYNAATLRSNASLFGMFDVVLNTTTNPPLPYEIDGSPLKKKAQEILQLAIAGRIPTSISPINIPLGSVLSGVLQSSTVFDIQLNISRPGKLEPDPPNWHLYRSSWASRAADQPPSEIYGVATIPVTDTQTMVQWQTWSSTLFDRQARIEPTTPSVFIKSFNKMLTGSDTDRWFDSGTRATPTTKSNPAALPVAVRAVGQDPRFGPLTYSVIEKIISLLQGLIDCALPEAFLQKRTLKDWQEWFKNLSVNDFGNSYAALVQALATCVLPTPSLAKENNLSTTMLNLVNELRDPSTPVFVNMQSWLEEQFTMRPTLFNELEGWLAIVLNGADSELFRASVEKNANRVISTKTQNKIYSFSDWIYNDNAPWGFFDALDRKQYTSTVAVLKVYLQGFSKALDYDSTQTVLVDSSTSNIPVNPNIEVPCGTQIPGSICWIPLPMREPATAPAALFSSQMEVMQEQRDALRLFTQPLDEKAFAAGRFVAPASNTNTAIQAIQIEAAKAIEPAFDEAIVTFCWSIRGKDGASTVDEAFERDALILHINPLEHDSARFDRDARSQQSVGALDLTKFLVLPTSTKALTESQAEIASGILAKDVLDDVANLLRAPPSQLDFSGKVRHVRFSEGRVRSMYCQLTDPDSPANNDLGIQSATFAPLSATDHAFAYIVCNLKLSVWSSWEVTAELVRNAIASDAADPGSLLAPEFSTFANQEGDPRSIQVKVTRDFAQWSRCQSAQVVRRDYSPAELIARLLGACLPSYTTSPNSVDWRQYDVAISCTPIQKYTLPSESLSQAGPEGQYSLEGGLGQGAHFRLAPYSSTPAAQAAWEQPQQWFPTDRRHFVLRVAWFTAGNVEFFTVDNVRVELP